MQEILQAIGLSPDEITAYNVLGDLVAKGLARQIGEADKAGIMKFALEHPSKIKEVIEGEVKKKEEAVRALESALPALTSRWNLVYHRPAVTYHEGLEGLRKIYTDIINEGQDILLIRSVY